MWAEYEWRILVYLKCSSEACQALWLHLMGPISLGSPKRLCKRGLSPSAWASCGSIVAIFGIVLTTPLLAKPGVCNSRTSQSMCTMIGILAISLSQFIWDRTFKRYFPFIWIRHLLNQLGANPTLVLSLHTLKSQLLDMGRIRLLLCYGLCL